MITRSLKAFEDLLASSVGPQVMPPWFCAAVAAGKWSGHHCDKYKYDKYDKYDDRWCSFVQQVNGVDTTSVMEAGAMGHLSNGAR